MKQGFVVKNIGSEIKFALKTEGDIFYLSRVKFKSIK
jgi:hypothetical protein